MPDPGSRKVAAKSGGRGGVRGAKAAGTKSDGRANIRRQMLGASPPPDHQENPPNLFATGNPVKYCKLNINETLLYIDIYF